MAEISWRNADDSMLADVDNVRLTAYNAANQSAWNVSAKQDSFSLQHGKGSQAIEVEIEMKTYCQGADTESLDSVAQRALDALRATCLRLGDVTTVNG